MSKKTPETQRRIEIHRFDPETLAGHQTELYKALLVGDWNKAVTSAAQLQISTFGPAVGNEATTLGQRVVLLANVLTTTEILAQSTAFFEILDSCIPGRININDAARASSEAIVAQRKGQYGVFTTATAKRLGAIYGLDYEHFLTQASVLSGISKRISENPNILTTSDDRPSQWDDLQLSFTVYFDSVKQVLEFINI